MTMRKLRVVIAKPGLDGHDRGAKVIARALRDAGMEVIYTGLRQTPEQIAVGRAAGGRRRHRPVDPVRRAQPHRPRLMELLKEKGLDDVLVVIGGIIPDVDIPKLKAIGVKGIFLPGTPMQEIIDFINANAPRLRVLAAMPYTLLLADDSVTIQRVIELTFATRTSVVAVSDGDQAIAQLDVAARHRAGRHRHAGRSGYEVARYIKQVAARSRTFRCCC